MCYLEQLSASNSAGGSAPVGPSLSLRMADNLGTLFRGNFAVSEEPAVQSARTPYKKVLFTAAARRDTQ